MNRLALTLLVTLATLPLAYAQDKGNWRAASKNASAITGDIALAPERISINFLGFPMSQIRSLEPAEVTATFDLDLATPNPGALYRLSIPGSKKFLHKNSLCGADDVQWLATYVSGKTLQLALFSGEKPPVFTREAIGASTDLCGTFTYTH
jgi:hypothetical protein